MTSEHSKGPWSVHGYLVLAADKSPVAEVYTAAAVTEENANARLIAAAPTLLRALIETTSFSHFFDEDTKALVEQAFDEAGVLVRYG